MKLAALLAAALLIARPLPADGLHHFQPPAYLQLEATLEAPPEIGREVGLRVRCKVEAIESLDVTLALTLPAGIESTGAALEAHRTVRRGTPGEWLLHVRSAGHVLRGSLVVRASAPYPVEAVRDYYRHRLPLYGEHARQEFRELVATPPARLETEASVQISVTPDEARIGLGPPPASYLKEGYALETISCGGLARGEWHALLEELQAGTLLDPDGWCRLSALASLELGQGKPRVAAGVWQAMLTRLSSAPKFAEHRDALASNLAVGLAMLGQTAAASAEWTRLEGTPLAAHARFNLGVSREAAGDAKGAAAAYRAALERSPGFTRARERLRAVEGK